MLLVDIKCDSTIERKTAIEMLTSVDIDGRISAEE
jgi:hypothetical protein